MKTIPFLVASKYQGSNLTEEAKDLYPENYGIFIWEGLGM
jgi:hypothetical protein